MAYFHQNYFSAKYYHPNYWSTGVAVIVAAVKRKVRGLWSLKGTKFKARNIVKGEVK